MNSGERQCRQSHCSALIHMCNGAISLWQLQKNYVKSICQSIKRLMEVLNTFNLWRTALHKPAYSLAQTSQRSDLWPLCIAHWLCAAEKKVKTHGYIFQMANHAMRYTLWCNHWQRMEVHTWHTWRPQRITGPTHTSTPLQKIGQSICHFHQFRYYSLYKIYYTAHWPKLISNCRT